MAGESDNTATTDAPDTGAISTADHHADAEADAVLARIMGGGESQNKPEQKAETKNTGERDRDDRGRFSAASKDKPQEPEAEPEQKPEPELPEGISPDDYRKALKALQYDGVPQKTLDALDPSEIVGWGLKRSKVHADIDRLKTDLSKAKAASKKTQSEATGESAIEVDWKKLVEPVATQFHDDVGVDLSEPLTAFARQIAESATASLQSKLAQQHELIEAIQSQFRNQQQEAARSKLSEKFKLDDDDRWQRVLERRSSDKNEYDSEFEAVQAACRIEFADEIISDYQAKLAEQHTMRSKGQSTTQHRKTPPKSMSQEDIEDRILGAILDGDTDTASRLGRRSNTSAGELMAMEM